MEQQPVNETLLLLILAVMIGFVIIKAIWDRKQFEKEKEDSKRRLEELRASIEAMRKEQPEDGISEERQRMFEEYIAQMKAEAAQQERTSDQE